MTDQFADAHRPSKAHAPGCTAPRDRVRDLDGRADQRARGRAARTAGSTASLTTCGIVAGGVQLNNYQLDGEYAIDQLLNPTQRNIELVNFPDPHDPARGLATGYALDALAQTSAQTTRAPGRARLALAMSLMNVADWAPGQAMPSPFDFAAQEQGQYDIEFRRPAGRRRSRRRWTSSSSAGRYIELAAGGNATWTKGVNFARLLLRVVVRARGHQPVPRGGAQPERATSAS